jgi:hypothetical protein
VFSRRLKAPDAAVEQARGPAKLVVTIGGGGVDADNDLVQSGFGQFRDDAFELVAVGNDGAAHRKPAHIGDDAGELGVHQRFAAGETDDADAFVAGALQDAEHCASLGPKRVCRART